MKKKSLFLFWVLTLSLWWLFLGAEVSALDLLKTSKLTVPTISAEIKPISKSYNCAGQTQIPVSECEALVQFYNVSWWPNWTNKNWWLVTNTPCTWHGITCNTATPLKNVITIWLNNNNLSGTIYLSGLVSLQNLDFGYNQISSISANQFEWLINLRTLLFSHNQINSISANQFAWLVNLQILLLNGNPTISPNIIDVESLPLTNLGCPTNYNETPAEQKCVLSGYVEPIQTGKCTWLPANAQRNTVSQISQILSGWIWFPILTWTYNITPSTTTCNFVCNQNYTWNWTSCIPTTQTIDCPISTLPSDTAGLITLTTQIIQYWDSTGYTEGICANCWRPNQIDYTYTSNYTSWDNWCFFNCQAGYQRNWSECIVNECGSGMISVGDNAWHNVWLPWISQWDVLYPNFIIWNDWTKYIAYRDNLNNWKIVVSKWNGNSWENLAITSNTNSRFPRLFISPDNSLYLLYTTDNNNPQIQVKKRNGSSRENIWESSLTWTAWEHDMTIWSDWTIYIVYKNITQWAKTTVQKRNWTLRENMWWITIYNGVNDTNRYEIHQEIILWNDNVPYIAYTEYKIDQARYTTFVKKRNGSTWEQLWWNISNTIYHDMEVWKDGNIYIAYNDNLNWSWITVSKRNGTTRENVWWVNISNWLAYISENWLSFDNDWNMYVWYMDKNIWIKATVKKRDGQTRTLVWNAWISSGRADWVNTAIAPDGTVNIAYKDTSNGWKATVLEYLEKQCILDILSD